jgi:ABC-type transport system substrate-binding protein
MKSSNLYKNLAVFVLFAILLWGCKQPETVVIDDEPTTMAPSDTTEQYSSNKDDSDFRKLVIGEYQSITSFDPLLAKNGATMRTLQLIYEGLVRLDANENITPAVAKKWEISNDSLTYKFTLNSDIYYQDSDIFSTGTGRRLLAQDVKYIFERMAKDGNPSTAAKLFWNIKGFEPYYQEQHNVYEPAKRTLTGVTGIQAPNDSTVVFELHEKDSKFLKKLATPYAVIYPKEAANSRQQSFAPIGTGPFTLSSQKGDSTFIFAKSEKYHAVKDIQLNRVDVITSNSESKLMRNIGTGDIHFLPELGPNIIRNVTSSEGVLKTGFTNRYNLTTRNNFQQIVLRSNPSANLADKEISSLRQLAYANANTYFNQLPENIVKLDSISSTKQADTTLSTNRLYSVFSDDPFARTYLGNLSKTLNGQGVTLGMTEFHTPTRDIELLVTHHAPLISINNNFTNYPELFRFRVYPTALYLNNITGLNFNQHSWWLDLRGVSLPSLDKLN